MNLPKDIPEVLSHRKNDNILNILLAGKHKGNIDTFILAQINIPKKQITLLSIPRDIFFNGRKINSAYFFYGIDELKRELGIITGYHIDYFMIIDMYAFIEVVDILGGIALTLDTPLIDPTYKTFNHGKWGTLYYSKGEYHLNGTEALRIARSRYTTSDFSRAQRQQKILLALKNKAKNFKVGDVGKITKIIQVLLKKVETDLSLKEALSYFLRFRGYQLRNGFVLSTADVLSSKHQDQNGSKKCYQQLLKSNEVVEISCPLPINGQYILFPRRDWNTVRWYVREIFETD